MFEVSRGAAPARPSIAISDARARFFSFPRENNSNVHNVHSSQADFHTAVEICVFTCEDCEHWKCVYDVEEKEDDSLHFSSLISASNVHKPV